MKKVTIIVILILTGIAGLSLAVSATEIPTWIKPGLTLNYDVTSAFIKDGQYNTPAVVKGTIVVNSVAGNAVDITQTMSFMPPGQGIFNVTDKRLTPGQKYDKFWVNPADPAGSVTGPNGETMARIDGDMKFNCAGRDWSAAILNYANEDSGVRYTLIYDKETGLVLAYTEKYPSQFVYMRLNSIEDSGDV